MARCAAQTPCRCVSLPPVGGLGRGISDSKLTIFTMSWSFTMSWRYVSGIVDSRLRGAIDSVSTAGVAAAAVACMVKSSAM